MDESSVQKAMQDAIGKKRARNKILIVIALFLMSGLIVILFYPSALTSSGQKAEDVAFISQSDTEFQQGVKNITGYDWVSFVTADGSEKSKTAAMLFLAEEISILDDNFNFVNRSVGLKKSELGMTRLNATDASKTNLLKLAANAQAANNIFASKGLASAKIRSARLAHIEGFFGKYPKPEGQINSGQSLFSERLGLSAGDYQRLISLMIVNYNLFVIA